MESKVEYLRHMGSDLDVVNNARVSFNKQKEVMSLTDEALLRYLAEGVTRDQKNAIIAEAMEFAHFNAQDKLWDLFKKYRNTPTHWAPFANGIRVSLRITTSIFNFRQLYKHKAGMEESEVSRRYITDEPMFLDMDYRAAAPNVKQGSSDDLHFDHLYFESWAASLEHDSKVLYNEMIKKGVCAEQARTTLPQSMMTTAIVSQSLYGWSRIYLARSDRYHAQREIADVADLIAPIMADLYPLSWKALVQ